MLCNWVLLQDDLSRSRKSVVWMGWDGWGLTSRNASQAEGSLPSHGLATRLEKYMAIHPKPSTKAQGDGKAGPLGCIEPVGIGRPGTWTPTRVCIL